MAKTIDTSYIEQMITELIRIRDTLHLIESNQDTFAEKTDILIQEQLDKVTAIKDRIVDLQGTVVSEIIVDK